MREEEKSSSRTNRINGVGNKCKQLMKMKKRARLLPQATYQTPTHSMIKRSDELNMLKTAGEPSRIRKKKTSFAPLSLGCWCWYQVLVTSFSGSANFPESGKLRAMEQGAHPFSAAFEASRTVIDNIETV